jgi:hypothetical protein
MANLLLLLFMYAPSAPYRVLLPSMTVASAGCSCTSVVIVGGGVAVSPAVALVVGGSPSVGAGIILSGDILSDAV